MAAEWTVDPNTGLFVPPTQSTTPGGLPTGALSWLPALLGGSAQAGPAVPVTSAPVAPPGPLFRPGSVLDRMFGPGTPPVVPPAIMPPTPSPLDPGLPTPRNVSRVQVDNAEKTFSFPAGPELPAPPGIPAPPQQRIPGAGDYSGLGVKPGDFSKAREFADKGKPGPVDQASLDKAHWGDVLGGLAGGAGSVSATEAGSFARALAMAGAGGSKGSSTANVRNYEANANKDKENQAFYQHRAGLEKDITNAGTQVNQFNANLQKDIITAKVAQDQVASQVAFHNAKAIWDTTIQNQNTQYEFGLKKLQLEQPQVKQDANGVSITQMDPTTRQWKLRYIPTKPLFENLEKMEATFKGLNVPGEAAKAANVQMIAQQYQNDPLGAREVLKRLAVKDLIDSGAGSQVFGQAFQKAATAVKTELDAIPGLAAKPEVYLQEMNNRISARILNYPEVGASLDWAIRGVAHSPYARILAGQGQPTPVPTGTVPDFPH